jgi:hypothetical protein
MMLPDLPVAGKNKSQHKSPRRAHVPMIISN